MFCTNCGAQLPDGAKFCTECGAEFTSGKSAQNEGATTQNSLPNENAGASSSTTHVAPSAQAPSRRQGRKPLYLALACTLLIAVVGGAGFLVYQMFFAPYTIDEETFPDAGVRAAVQKLDVDGDGKLERDVCAEVTSLSIFDASEIKGLGSYFPNLDTLTVSNSNILTLDTSDLGHLTHLSAYGSVTLDAIDVSRNTELTELAVPDSTEVTGLNNTQLVEYWLPTEIINEKFKLAYSATYNESGQPIVVTYRSLTYGSSDPVGIPYRYDDEGRLIGYEQESPDLNCTFVYDEDGNLVEKRRDPDAVSSSAKYEYDDEGNLEIQYRVISGGSDKEIPAYEWTYDDEGRPVSLIQPENNRLIQTWEYDDEGRLATHTYLGWGFEMSAETNVYRVSFTYDENDRINGTSYEVGPNDTDHMDSLDPKSITERGTTTYIYDDQGRLTEASSSDGSSAVCTYDDAGNLISVSNFDEEGDETTYDVDYQRLFLNKEDSEPRPPLASTPRMSLAARSSCTSHGRAPRSTTPRRG